MRRRFLIMLLLAGCAMPTQLERPEAGAVETDLRPTPPPPPTARTAEQFDTTTDAQRVAAAAPSAGGRRLGTTVASLGDPARPGFWIETALVSEPGAGRLVNPATGKSVEVSLIPVEGGSSRVSLAALRVLEAPLGDLSELEVYSN